MTFSPPYSPSSSGTDKEMTTIKEEEDKAEESPLLSNSSSSNSPSVMSPASPSLADISTSRWMKVEISMNPARLFITESSIVNPVLSTPIALQQHNVQPNNQLVLSHTPNGSERLIRVVESKFRPKIGTVFSSLEAGIEFYGVYARACGFTPRKYTAKKLRGGIAHQKLIVCNRQGFRGNKQKLRSIPVDEHNNGDCSSTVETVKRRVKITRVGCRAYVRFTLLNRLEGPTMIDDFSESHNHHLTSVSNRDLEKISRCLDMFHKQLILDNFKLNIGAAKTFRQVKELVHGYENIGATLMDFKNFQRDIKCYIGERDADLFLDRLEKLKATQPQFYFAYDVDASNFLTKVIWADSTSIRNYSFFRDDVSFDPTYDTNKYDMVFTPFTGVNHHRKSVFSAACLLSHEDELSFKWAFQHFLSAMGQKEPQFLIMDQCPGIKKAFPSVFKQARHRYCMWHITQKITDKVGSALFKDTDFFNRFNAVVWDSVLEPFEFEDKWQQLISDFQLEDNDWLSTMFTDRKHWIPAYHRDLPMGCILRTTQQSESANSFFKRYENHFGTLVEFWMRCDDDDSDHSLPNLDTNIHLEKHGAIVYTHAVFKMFQEEGKAAISCGVADFDKEDNLRIIFVEDAESNRTLKVTFNLSTTDAECACKLFEKIGLLCRHIVWVYKGKGIRQIPRKYILDRWAKNSYATNRLDPNGNVIEDSNMAQSDNSLVCKLWAEFSTTVGVLKTLPPAHMDELASLLVEFREKLSVIPLTKDQEMEMLLG
ncbi:protein FAR1-RELATED SEQUENCE 5-like [Silene latifolia]|uniref:protein FAR1-RELATED SEQUENCE 5-like n=1 Tax=Silene latifolia TaxID=37657 RepID=UPI003D773A9C